MREYAYEKCEWIFECFDRHERQDREDAVKAEVQAHFAEQFEGRAGEIDDALYYLNKEIMRKKILEQGVRRTAATCTRYARSGARRACCRARTALPCSPAVKRRS